MDMFADKEKWVSSLPTKWAGKNLIYHHTLVSTNVTAAALGKEGAPHGTLVTADSQTGGRGRSGRTWHSPVGKNLYFSLLLKPEFEIEKASMLTLVMAHSVAVAMERIAVGCRVGIKWPNDILVNGKKVCGILTELRAEHGRIDQIVIGVGVNVKPQTFEEELADKATSLENEWNIVVDRETLLRHVMETFEEDYEAFVRQGDLGIFLQDYHSRLLNKDAYVRVLDPRDPFEGIARGITENGELLVERSGGSVVKVYAGEVSVRGLLGYV